MLGTAAPLALLLAAASAAPSPTPQNDPPAAAPAASPPAAAPAAAPKTAKPLKPASGVVTYVTQTDAFVNVGKKQGLAAGQKLTMMRRGRKVGACEVIEVSDRRAICRGDRVDRGDRFTFMPDVSVMPAAKPQELQPKPRPPMPTAEELAARRASVLAVPVPQVVFERSEAVTTRATASLMLREQVWAISTVPDGTFARTSIDAAARASLGLGFLPTAYGAAALRVTGDLLAPPDQRFRPGELVELYVWGASVGTSDGPVITEIGRFYPQKAPGLSLLDGAQLGVRFLGETTEVGVYAGAIPDVVTTLPTPDRLAAGAYMGADIAAGDDVLILPRARLGVMSTPDFAILRGEVEALTQLLWRDVLSLGGSLRAGVGGTAQVVPSLDAGRADVALLAVPGLTLTANYRYLAPLAVDYDLISKVTPVGGAHHGAASAAYRLFSFLSLGATAGAGYDLVSEALRGYAGPEIGLPELFGAWGGMDLGYLEELGSWPGRSGWVGAQLRPVSILRIGTRVSYFETEAQGDNVRETAMMLYVDAPVLPWLNIRGRGFVQQGLPTLLDVVRATPTVIMADLAVTGTL